MFNWLFYPVEGQFALNVWTALGTILLCIIFGVLILLAVVVTFSKVIRILIGSGIRPARIICASAIYVPLIGWWCQFVRAGNAGFKEWAAFIALLIFLNYIPVNILSHVLDHIAVNRSIYKMRRVEVNNKRTEVREMKKLMRRAKKANRLDTQERLQEKADILAQCAHSLNGGQK